MKERHEGFAWCEIYNGKDGGAYRGSRYLAKAITSEGRDILFSSFPPDEGADFEQASSSKGGIIVFSTDACADKQYGTGVADKINEKMTAIGNLLNATRKNRQVAAAGSLVGWTMGHYLHGRYTAPNGKQYGENSWSVEIVGADAETLVEIAMQLCESFPRESVLVKANGAITQCKKSKV